MLPENRDEAISSRLILEYNVLFQKHITWSVETGRLRTQWVEFGYLKIDSESNQVHRSMNNGKRNSEVV